MVNEEIEKLRIEDALSATEPFSIQHSTLTILHLSIQHSSNQDVILR